MCCNVSSCKENVKFIVQSPKQKLHTCEGHLLETLDSASGKEFFVIKIDVV